MRVEQVLNVATKAYLVGAAPAMDAAWTVAVDPNLGRAVLRLGVFYAFTTGCYLLGRLQRRGGPVDRFANRVAHDIVDAQYERHGWEIPVEEEPRRLERDYRRSGITRLDPGAEPTNVVDTDPQ